MYLCIPYTYSATVTLTYTHTFVSLTHTFCHNTYIHLHICITTHTFCHDNTYLCMHLCIPYTHVQSWQHLHIHALLYPLHTWQFSTKMSKKCTLFEKKIFVLRNQINNVSKICWWWFLESTKQAHRNLCVCAEICYFVIQICTLGKN